MVFSVGMIVVTLKSVPAGSFPQAMTSEMLEVPAGQDRSVTAPTRPPLYIDAIAGQEPLPPGEAVPWLVGNLVSAAQLFPQWVIEDLTIPLHLQPNGGSIIGFTAGGVSGTIAFAQDSSDWLLAVAEIEGRELFRGYIERAYEEYDIWPPDAGAAEGEAPGRIGKHASWISLDARAWPTLSPLAPQGWFNTRLDEKNGAWRPPGV